MASPHPLHNRPRRRFSRPTHEPLEVLQKLAHMPVVLRVGAPDLEIDRLPSDFGLLVAPLADPERLVRGSARLSPRCPPGARLFCFGQASSQPGPPHAPRPAGPLAGRIRGLKVPRGDIRGWLDAAVSGEPLYQHNSLSSRDLGWHNARRSPRTLQRATFFLRLCAWLTPLGPGRLSSLYPTSSDVVRRKARSPQTNDPAS